MREADDDRLRQLFETYLAARETGDDRLDELLTEAGPLAERLRRRIEEHRQLDAIGGTFGRPEPAPPPHHVGRFRILGPIGEGGLSQVWRGFDPLLKREIALKILKGPLFAAGTTPWVLNEARALARIRHEGVLQVLEIGEDPECPYIAMELLPGPTLREVVDELARRKKSASSGTPATPERLAAAADRYASIEARVECLARVAEALAHCHERHVLHRDVKPTNVMLDEEFQPRLIDFGLAHDAQADDDSKLDLTTQLVGTAGYLAPEQVDDQRTGADGRSDQFSLGTLSYEWLALEHPFERDGRAATLDAISRCHPRPLHRTGPGISPALSAVVHGPLQRLREERYPDLAEYAADLRRVLRHEAPLRSAPSFAHLMHLWLRRNRRAVVGACGVVALTAASLGGIWYAGAAREHEALLEALTGVDPGTLSAPGDFRQRGRELMNLNGQVRDHDAARIRRLLFGALAQPFQEECATWSRRLQAVCQEERAHSTKTHIPFQFEAFRELFLMDEQLCPQCPDPRDERRRGTVRFPPELDGQQRALYLVAPGPDDSSYVFQPTAFADRLVPGFYRAHFWKQGSPRLSAEFEFRVEGGWPPMIELPYPPRPREELGRWLRFAASPFPVAGASFEVPAFLLLDHLVTVAEFDVFRGATGLQLAEERTMPKDPEAAAWVSIEEARAFCLWFGGRLPTLQERLRAAREQGLVCALSARIGGEYLMHGSEAGAIGQNALLQYSRSIDEPEGTLVAVGGISRSPSGLTLKDRTTMLGVGFRVAFSNDTPANHRKNASLPFTRPTPLAR